MGNFYLRLWRCAWALVVFLSASAQAQQNWQDQNIYQIITDRFFNGDVANDNADGNFNASAAQAVHGGDFKGIEQKLDYIKALGATAIWISPVVLNANGDYHGYAAGDFYQVAPHFGTLDDLKHLVAAAHAKGLLVIDDIVVNHGALLLNSNDADYPNFRLSPPYNLFYRDNSKQYPPPFDTGGTSGRSIADLFHANGYVQDFSNPTQLELGSYVGLDDFRTETSYVQTQMANIYKFWMDQGFDAFRIDTVKHVDHGFWDSWCAEMRQHAIDIGKPDFFIFGEVSDRSETKNASYTGRTNGGAFELDSVLDYPLYYAINSVFALGTGNTKQLDDHFAAVQTYYDPAARQRLVTFVDNHDQPRFVSAANSRWAQTRLGLALTFLHTAPGIPCVYYGTEQGFNGGNDPNNREDMFAGQFEPGYASQNDNFNMAHPLFYQIALLNNARRLYPALRSGSLVSLLNFANGPGLYAYSRRLGNQEIVVLINSSEVDWTATSNVHLTYPPFTKLVNIFNPNDYTAVAQDGTLYSTYMPALTAKILIAESQLLTLDPWIWSINPAHDAKNVSVTSKVGISFDQAMDTASVEAAFSTTPTTTGRFTWSADHKNVSYQAIGGWPGQTQIQFHIGTGAMSAAGRHSYSPFDARFTTGSAGAADTTPPTVTILSPQDGSVMDLSHTMQVSATDSANIDHVEHQLDGGAWVNSYGSTQSYTPAPTVTWYPNIQWIYLPNGWHTVSFRAFDSYGNVSDPVSITVRSFFRPGIYEKWLDANYGGTVDCSHNVWESEEPYDASQSGSYGYNYNYGYIGGTGYQSYNYISNVCNNEQIIYQSERFCSPVETFRYLFKCPPGVYQVTLHEAETYKNGPNQRRFDVYLNGDKKFSDIDIFAAAGGANLAVTFTNQVNVSNGLLEVLFKPVYDYARSSGIHVKKISDIYSDTDGIPDWWRLGVFGHATGLAADQSRAGDDPDGDGMTNYQEFVAGTDGLDPNSVLNITALERSGNDLIITFNSNQDEYYDLQQRDRFDISNWTTYTSHLPGTGPNRKIYVSGGATPGSPPRFYRVVVSPQQ